MLILINVDKTLSYWLNQTRKNGDYLTIKVPSYQHRDSHVIEIRRSHDLLIFIMGIPIPGKTIFKLNQGPDFHSFHTPSCICYLYLAPCHTLSFAQNIMYNIPAHVYVSNEASMLTIDFFLHFMPSTSTTLWLPLPALDLNTINPFQRMLTIPIIISKLWFVLNVCYCRSFIIIYVMKMESNGHIFHAV